MKKATYDKSGIMTEAWPGTSVWSLAMRAVKLHIKLFGQAA